MVQLTLQQAFTLATEHHGAGRLAEAEQLYRQILAQQPEHPETLQLLGVLAHQVGRNDDALELIRRAIALRPESADAHSNLGSVFKATGRLDEAIAAYRQAIVLDPCVPEAHRNLGNSLYEKGRLDEAIAAFREALELRPGHADVHNNLGIVLRERGRLEEAIATFRRALDCDPSFAFAWNNLGGVLRDTGQYAAAIAACRHAIALRPGDAAPRNTLGTALRLEGRVEEALAAYREALALDPNLAEAHSNLGSALNGTGQLDEAVAAYRRAIALNPGLHVAHSNIVYALHFDPASGSAAIAAEARRWDAQHGAPLRGEIRPWPNDRDPARRLKIGYVSPDFYDQAETFFTAPLLAAHDHAQFEIHCYASVARPDAFTDRLRGCADVWHDVLGDTDAELADRIRADGIDVLVDLTMHMGYNRLPVFARKPAPVQVAWLAYPGGTGLAAMDYRITDAFMDPPDRDDAMYVEKSVRLPGCWVCYDPLQEPLPVGPPPALAAGHITFGSLNNFCKVNPAVLTLWAQVFRAVPDSRLRLLAPEGSARQRPRELLAALGIAPERLEFVGTCPRDEYLRSYGGIDIALDPFPYNGITTTCDALWMGVPVVTFAGETAASRAGLGLLSTVGLPELAGRDAEEFVQIAVALACDLPRLAALRAGLREKMERSPLMDAPGFARNLEAAYREMWRAWCAGR
jgi:predicted O-linked N-acetylglucosamine transferase (SPINDLY family)